MPREDGAKGGPASNNPPPRVVFQFGFLVSLAPILMPMTRHERADSSS